MRKLSPSRENDPVYDCSSASETFGDLYENGIIRKKPLPPAVDAESVRA
jgi:hypothetical protein